MTDDCRLQACYPFTEIVFEWLRSYKIRWTLLKSEGLALLKECFSPAAIHVRVSALNHLVLKRNKVKDLLVKPCKWRYAWSIHLNISHFSVDCRGAGAYNSNHCGRGGVFFFLWGAPNHCPNQATHIIWNNALQYFTLYNTLYNTMAMLWLITI